MIFSVKKENLPKWAEQKLIEKEFVKVDKGYVKELGHLDRKYRKRKEANKQYYSKYNK